MYHESWIPLLIWCCFALTTSNSSLKLPKSYFFQGMLAFLGYENHKFMQTRVLPVHLLFLWGIWMHRSLCSWWYPWLWNAVLWHLKPERPYNNQAVAFAADLAVSLRCPGSSFHDLFACLRGRCRASFYDCYSSTLGSSFRCNMFGSKHNLEVVSTIPWWLQLSPPWHQLSMLNHSPLLWQSYSLNLPADPGAYNLQLRPLPDGLHRAYLRQV